MYLRNIHAISRLRLMLPARATAKGSLLRALLGLGLFLGRLLDLKKARRKEQGSTK